MDQDFDKNFEFSGFRSSEMPGQWRYESTNNIVVVGSTTVKDKVAAQQDLPLASSLKCPVPCQKTSFPHQSYNSGLPTPDFNQNPGQQSQQYWPPTPSYAAPPPPADDGSFHWGHPYDGTTMQQNGLHYVTGSGQIHNNQPYGTRNTQPFGVAASEMVQNSQPFAIGPGEMVHNGQPFANRPGETVHNGQPFAIRPGEMVQYNGQLFAKTPGEMVHNGQPFANRPGEMVHNGQPFSMGPYNSHPIPIGPSEVVHNGKLFANGPGEIVHNGQPFGIGPGEIIHNSQHFPIGPREIIHNSQPFAVKENEMIQNNQPLAIGPGEIVCNSQTYAIPPSEIVHSGQPFAVLTNGSCEMMHSTHQPYAFVTEQIANVGQDTCEIIKGQVPDPHTSRPTLENVHKYRNSHSSRGQTPYTKPFPYSTNEAAAANTLKHAPSIEPAKIHKLNREDSFSAAVNPSRPETPVRDQNKSPISYTPPLRINSEMKNQSKSPSKPWQRIKLANGKIIKSKHLESTFNKDKPKINKPSTSYEVLKRKSSDTMMATDKEPCKKGSSKGSNIATEYGNKGPGRRFVKHTMPDKVITKRKESKGQPEKGKKKRSAVIEKLKYKLQKVNEEIRRRKIDLTIKNKLIKEELKSIKSKVLKSNDDHSCVSKNKIKIGEANGHSTKKTEYSEFREYIKSITKNQSEPSKKEKQVLKKKFYIESKTEEANKERLNEQVESVVKVVKPLKNSKLKQSLCDKENYRTHKEKYYIIQQLDLKRSIHNTAKPDKENQSIFDYPKCKIKCENTVFNTKHDDLVIMFKNKDNDEKEQFQERKVKIQKRNRIDESDSEEDLPNPAKIRKTELTRTKQSKQYTDIISESESLTDLSFLDDINVDEIVEYLNSAEEQANCETDISGITLKSSDAFMSTASPVSLIIDDTVEMIIDVKEEGHDCNLGNNEIETEKQTLPVFVISEIGSNGEQLPSLVESPALIGAAPTGTASKGDPINESSNRPINTIIYKESTTRFTEREKDLSKNGKNLPRCCEINNNSETQKNSSFVMYHTLELLNIELARLHGEPFSAAGTGNALNKSAIIVENRQPHVTIITDETKEKITSSDVGMERYKASAQEAKIAQEVITIIDETDENAHNKSAMIVKKSQPDVIIISDETEEKITSDDVGMARCKASAKEAKVAQEVITIRDGAEDAFIKTAISRGDPVNESSNRAINTIEESTTHFTEHDRDLSKNGKDPPRCCEINNNSETQKNPSIIMCHTLKLLNKDLSRLHDGEAFSAAGAVDAPNKSAMIVENRQPDVTITTDETKEKITSSDVGMERCKLSAQEAKIAKEVITIIDETEENSHKKSAMIFEKRQPKVTTITDETKEKITSTDVGMARSKASAQEAKVAQEVTIIDGTEGTFIKTAMIVEKRPPDVIIISDETDEKITGTDVGMAKGKARTQDAKVAQEVITITDETEEVIKNHAESQEVIAIFDGTEKDKVNIKGSQDCIKIKDRTSTTMQKPTVITLHNVKIPKIITAEEKSAETTITNVENGKTSKLYARFTKFKETIETKKDIRQAEAELKEPREITEKFQILKDKGGDLNTTEDSQDIGQSDKSPCKVLHEKEQDQNLAAKAKTLVKTKKSIFTKQYIEKMTALPSRGTEKEFKDKAYYYLEQLELIASQEKEFALAAKLEERVSDYMNLDLRVCSVLHRGRFSILFNCIDPEGLHVTAKITNGWENTDTNARKAGYKKETMLMRLQDTIPKDKLHLVYLINGLALDGTWCLLMDHYPKNLEQALRESGRGLNINLVLKLAKQILSAVAMLRNNGIVHSDIKPTHILLNADNATLKLCGFDDSYYCEEAQKRSNIGTIHYRAPEVILGHSAGNSIDVWATAVVLYEMATGQRLYPGTSNNEVLHQHLSTLGDAPWAMVQSSAFKDAHYTGEKFRRIQFVTEGNDTKMIYEEIPTFPKTDVVARSLLRAYTRNWCKVEKDRDVMRVRQLYSLLSKMLVLDPRSRISILKPNVK